MHQINNLQISDLYVRLIAERGGSMSIFNGTTEMELGSDHGKCPSIKDLC
jgi:hypothetical protein